jgi:threonine/homoserine/homoserine lactone efflux protein
MMIETLFSFSLATFILAISPGPDNIFVLTQSIVNGKKSGLATVFGLITGCLVHTSLLAFGVSAIIAESDFLFLGIKIFGATYLLFLAYQVQRSESIIIFSATQKNRKTLWQLGKQGFIMNVLNPKVSIFFLAFFPSFLFNDRMSTIYQFYILGLIFMGISFLVFATIALLAGFIFKKLKTHTSVGNYLKWIQFCVFILIAIFILY